MKAVVGFFIGVSVWCAHSLRACVTNKAENVYLRGEEKQRTFPDGSVETSGNEGRVICAIEKNLSNQTSLVLRSFLFQTHSASHVLKQLR